MKIGLIDVDGHNFPNLPLMKLTTHHRAKGDCVDWWNGFERYDMIYIARVFTDEYSEDVPIPYNADVIVKGGTGYNSAKLSAGAEHCYPDYSLYPKLTRDIAYGFLTRGCPRNCPFCIVSGKEGCEAHKVANLSEFWHGQKYIKLLDPNLLASNERTELLQQLVTSRAIIDFTQGLDIRLINTEIISLLSAMRTYTIHFAWDDPNENLIEKFEMFIRQYTGSRKHRPSVYVLTNYNTTITEDLYRIETLRRIGYDPYVMIFNKPESPTEMRLLQRWCNNRKIFNTQPDFRKYNPKLG